MSRPRIPLEDRFWQKVSRDSPVPAHRPELGPCWEWTAGHDSRSYGCFKLNGRPRIAHRVMWELAYGPIPDGALIDHKCHNRARLRISHLRPTDASGNQEHSLGAQAINKSVDLRGVSWHRGVGAWKAQVGHGGRNHRAGYHSTPKAATEAARTFRLQLHELNDMDRLEGRENGAQALAGAAT